MLVPGSLAALNIPPFKPGFPVTLSGGGTIRGGHPAVADLGLTPGHKSIIFGTQNAFLYVVLWDGSVAPGFPQTLPAESTGSPAIGDVDGDGVPDIVITYGSTFQPTQPGGVRAYKRDGTLIWDRPARDFSGGNGHNPVIDSPVIGDVDGDGDMEVAWGGTDGWVYLVKGADGTDLSPAWPIFVRDSVRSSPALHDIDGDGRPDVIIGVDAHLEGPPFNTPNGGCLHVFRFDGTEAPGFPQCVDQTIVSSPAVGDIDGDGKPEIVVGTGQFYSPATHAVYAFKCNGQAAAGWPVLVDGQVGTSPALADVNGDGRLDVIVTDDNSGPSGVGHVYVFKGDGTLLHKAQPKDFVGTTPDAADPMVADMAGDGSLDILVPVNTEIVVLTVRNGQLVQLTDDGTHFAGNFSLFTSSPIFNAVVANFEAGGGSDPIEVVGVSSDGSGNTQVWVWNPQDNLGHPKISTNIPWGAFHQNPVRTGVFPGSPTCAGPLASNLKFFTLTPCRAVDTRNAAGPYGGPRLAGGTARAFNLPGSACGIPSNAAAVSVNLTVVLPDAAGDLRLYPGSGSPPLASTINYRSGDVRANNAIAALISGQCSLRSDQPGGTSTDVLIDVNGYWQ